MPLREGAAESLPDGPELYTVEDFFDLLKQQMRDALSLQQDSDKRKFAKDQTKRPDVLRHPSSWVTDLDANRDDSLPGQKNYSFIAKTRDHIGNAHAVAVLQMPAIHRAGSIEPEEAAMISELMATQITVSIKLPDIKSRITDDVINQSKRFVLRVTNQQDMTDTVYILTEEGIYHSTDAPTEVEDDIDNDAIFVSAQEELARLDAGLSILDESGWELELNAMSEESAVEIDGWARVVELYAAHQFTRG